MERDDSHSPDPSGAGSAGDETSAKTGGETSAKTGGETSREASRSSTEDALRRLEERLGRASEAAERLLAEAARSAAGRVAAAADRAAEPRPPQTPPPAGWEPPREADGPTGKAPGEAELDSLLGIVRSLRDLIPADLERRLTEALRELLLALRALIDWYLERIEQRRSEPVQVQDIPIL